MRAYPIDSIRMISFSSEQPLRKRYGRIKTGETTPPRIAPSFSLLSNVSLLTFFLTLLFPGRSIAQSDPFNPTMITLPEIGRMSGTIPSGKGGDEEFGLAVSPIGDIDHSGMASFVVEHLRCDTTFDEEYPLTPVELLLYRGIKGGFPAVESGVRIGPSELGSMSHFIASGDFDGSGNVSLCIREYIIGDTTDGNTEALPVGRLVVYWGNATGTYSNDDTTHLSNGADYWNGPQSAAVVRRKGSDHDDLFTFDWAGAGLRDGKAVSVPKMLMFQGHKGGRWGRSGIARTPDWNWWHPPPLRAIRAIDHDGDGYTDIAIRLDSKAEYGKVAVLYGRANDVPDTNEYQTIDLASANGRTSIMSDITGDRVPELSVACGTDEVVRVYVGRKGQRLLEQFGNGNEPPNPGNPDHWWGKPWAEIRLPRNIDPALNSGGFQPLYDLGDVGLDGIGDIFVSVNDGLGPGFLACYNGGRNLDSYIDAKIDLPSSYRGIRRMGDIDGSGKDTYAATYYYSPGTIVFFRPSKRVPQSGETRQLPPGTETPASATERRIEDNQIGSLFMWPNPAGDIVHLCLGNIVTTATITIADPVGRELRRYILTEPEPQQSLDLTNWPLGMYLITISTGSTSLTQMLIHR